MSRLEEITDDVIKNIDFSKHIMGEEALQADEFTDVEDVLLGFRNSRLSLAFILRFEEEIRLKYAKECSEASLEKASESATYDYDQKHDWISVNKESITQESNIVIL